MSWTHPICDTCYSGMHGDREPVRLNEAVREDEKCCLCGTITRSGIYVRLDPKDVLYPSDA
jgi:hypothetical protein